MKYTIIFTDILSIIHHPNLSLDNFFTTLNSEYYQFYVGSSISLSMVTINLDATKPYGSFNVSSDDVISGRYTEDNPYITCT